MAHIVTLIPGDGIGPEVVKATVRILEATGVKFQWESFAAGAEAYEKYKEYIPKELTQSIERTHIGLKGPVTTDRKSTRLNSSHSGESRMPSSA